MSLLYKWNCFGKSSLSKCFPRLVWARSDNSCPCIWDYICTHSRWACRFACRCHCLDKGCCRIRQCRFGTYFPRIPANSGKKSCSRRPCRKCMCHCSGKYWPCMDSCPFRIYHLRNPESRRSGRVHLVAFRRLHSNMAIYCRRQFLKYLKKFINILSKPIEVEWLLTCFAVFSCEITSANTNIVCLSQIIAGHAFSIIQAKIFNITNI